MTFLSGIFLDEVNFKELKNLYVNIDNYYNMLCILLFENNNSESIT